MDEKIKAGGKKQGAADVIFDLNFVPQWARKPPGENHYKDKEYTDRERRDISGRDRRNSGRRRSEYSADRKRPKDGSEERSSPAARARRPREPLQDLPVTISFLPEQKRLSSLVRQIHHARRAYPLMDLASIFLHDTEGYLVKVEVNKESSDFVLYKCKCCKAVASKEEIMIRHLQSKHLLDYFEKQEIQTDPPSGQFFCVARCRKTGTLLGPPNHHSYTEKLNQIHQAHFSHLSLEEYKRSIETIQDSELIEQWKEESRNKTVYKLKSDPESEPVDIAKAEMVFSKMMPDLFEVTKRVVVPSCIARQLEDQNVIQMIRRFWQKESHFPLSLSFSLRAAFRHMHLYLFKAGKINFVTHIKPNPIRPEDAVENIKDILLYLEEHPGSTRKQLLEALRPGDDPKSPEAAEILKPLSWLVERGHMIEFFNGTLSVPLGRSR